MSRRRMWFVWSIALLVCIPYAIIAASRVLGGSTADDFELMIPATLGALAMVAVGGLIASRTSNPIGWILLAIPATTALSISAEALGHRAVSDTTAAWVAWLNTWPFLLSLMLLVAIFYLYPTGSVPSRRWRWPWRVYVTVTAVVTAGFALLPTVSLSNDAEFANPLGISITESVLGPITTIAGLLVVASGFAAFVSLVTRYRGADAEQRQQLRWLFLVGSIAAVLFPAMLVVGTLSEDRNEGALAAAGNILVFLLVTDLIIGIPLATGVAIFRYHLYDLSVVVRKTIVVATLAVFITTVYVAIVVGIGAIAGTAGGGVLSLVATAVVALLFQPARLQAQRLANRLVYGVRATPYEVIAGFSAKMSATVSTAEVLPDMAEAAGLGVGASSSRVTVFLPEGREAAHRWDRDGGASGGVTTSFPITYRGEPIGELAVTKPPSEPLSRAEEALLTDLTAHASLALHNVRLTEELGIRLAELDVQAAALRVSRERLVTARDAQRRGLQRDLQEGPERQLLRIGHRLAEAERAEPHEATAILEGLLDTANETLEGLRDLARGIFPPLLADKGIVAALNGLARKIGADVRVEAPGDFASTRFDDDVEACVYFCCLQTIQNVIRHAGNAPCAVTFEPGDGALAFRVNDAGPGFEPATTSWGMGLAIVQDRADALGGKMTVTSAPGAGTTVEVRIPAEALETGGNA